MLFTNHFKSSLRPLDIKSSQNELMLSLKRKIIYTNIIEFFKGPAQNCMLGSSLNTLFNKGSKIKYRNMPT